MRKMRLWIILALALTSGALAAMLALRYLQQQATPLSSREARAGKVVLAARNLTIGSTIGEADIKLIDWPGGVMPAGFLASAQEAIGRAVITPVAENEPLLTTKLSSKDGGAGLQVAIRDGMRAMSVKVDEVVGVSGFVIPNTRVDLVLILEKNEELNRPMAVSRTFLQNLQVLASGQVTEPDADGKPIKVSVVTLLVTPEDAELLALATREGRIQMALRNTLDTLTTNTLGANVRQLNGVPYAAAPRPGSARPRPRAPEPRAEPSVIIEGYRGGE